MGIGPSVTPGEAWGGARAFSPVSVRALRSSRTNLVSHVQRHVWIWAHGWSHVRSTKFRKKKVKDTVYPPQRNGAISPVTPHSPLLFSCIAGLKKMKEIGVSFLTRGTLGIDDYSHARPTPESLDFAMPRIISASSTTLFHWVTGARTSSILKT